MDYLATLDAKIADLQGIRARLVEVCGSAPDEPDDDQAPSEEEVRRALAATHPHPLGAVIEALRRSPMRTGEVAALLTLPDRDTLALLRSRRDLFTQRRPKERWDLAADGHIAFNGAVKRAAALRGV